MPTTYRDISRETTNVIFDKEVSTEIISKAIEESAFMQLAPRMQIAANGKKFQTIASDPTPSWVAETNAKPVGHFTFGTKEVMPYKMALIVPFSDEFRRDKAALYAECEGRIPKLFGRKFDSTIMSTTSPGDNFDVLGSCSKQSIVASGSTTVYDQFLTVDAAISENDGIMNAIALAPQGRSIVLGATDTTGHPLFTAGVGSGTVGNILGAGVQVRKGVYVAGDADTSTAAVVGVAGDFDNCAWGAVNSITGSISDEATITYTDSNSNTVTLNLWQQNMFAVRFEIELAFMVKDSSTFILLTGNTPTTTTTTTTTTTGA